MQIEEQVITNSNEHLDSFLSPSFNSYSTDQLAGIAAQVGRDNHRDQNDDFEFVAFREAADGGGVFYNDAVFPLFNRHRLTENRNRNPPPPPSETSEVDESEGVPANCFRIPNSRTRSWCKKSNSTGSSSSKRWKLLDLLRRSNSDGRESVGSLTLSSPAKNKAKKVPVSAHEALYVKNRELRKMDQKKSFLPYKQELVGLCTRRLGKAFSSF